jgi:hypothetical protein
MIDPNESSEPADVGEARAIILGALQSCADAGLSQEAVLTVLLSETLPRLVEAYGPQGVAAVLQHAGDVIAAGSLVQLRQ